MEPFKHNGITTERHECNGPMAPHDAHKWRPGSNTEFFTCPGAVVCQFCPNLIWRDLMVQHISRVHADKLGTPPPDSFANDLTDRVGVMVSIMTAVAGDPADNTSDVPAGFHEWWRQQVDDAAPMIERKAAEYGSNSLAEMGRMFARAQGRTVDDAEALEIGCAVYAKGKLERVLDAMLKGRLPSVDT